MHCPDCGSTKFTLMLELAHIDSSALPLTFYADDDVVCASCNRVFRFKELENHRSFNNPEGVSHDTDR